MTGCWTTTGAGAGLTTTGCWTTTVSVGVVTASTTAATMAPANATPIQSPVCIE